MKLTLETKLNNSLFKKPKTKHKCSLILIKPVLNRPDLFYKINSYKELHRTGLKWNILLKLGNKSWIINKTMTELKTPEKHDYPSWT